MHKERELLTTVILLTAVILHTSDTFSEAENITYYSSFFVGKSREREGGMKTNVMG